jgi:TorA maturation chaperone TorD
MSDAGLAAPPPVAPEDVARADFYALLARLFAAPPDAALLAAIAAAPPLEADVPREEGAESDLCAGWDALRAASAAADPEEVRQEYDDLFIGVGKSLVNLHGSHWIAGFMMDRPLADLRKVLNELGLARREGVSMVEDHLSALCETMRILVAGDATLPARSIAVQKTFFDAQIAPWAVDCCNAITQSPIAKYYAAVAQFALGFMALERDSIAME